MKRLPALILGCCFMTAQAQTAAPILSLHSADPTPARASDVKVDLVVLNPFSQILSYEPSAELAGALQAEQHQWPVRLRMAQPIHPVTLAPGQFVAIPYVFSLPLEASGEAVLAISSVAALRLVVDIRDVDSRADALPIAAGKQQDAERPPAASQIARAFANRFAFHEPIYFIYGPDAPAAKFQFSFKYRLVGENSKFGDMISPSHGLYFAYTQRSLWDLQADSSPFYDTSYMPELFFEWLASDDNNSAGWVHLLGLQTGFRHESNGKAGTDSRSLNIGYLRTGMVFGSLTGWQLIVAPRVFSYIGTASDNADCSGQVQISASGLS